MKSRASRRAEQSHGTSDDDSPYRLFFQLNPLPMWVFDERTLRFLEVNKAAVNLYGWSREEFLRLTVKDIRPPEELPKLAKALATEYQHRATRIGEWRHWKKDHTLLDVEVTICFVRFQGRDARLVMVNDLTARKQAEAALQRNAWQLNEAQRVAHVGSWEWDAATDRNAATDELCRIYGLPAGKPIPDFKDQDGTLYPHEVWVRLNAAVQKAMRTGRGYDLEIEALRNGEPIWVNTRGEVVRNARGKITGLRGTVQDITARKRAEAALRASEERLRLAQISGTVGIWDWDVEHNRLWWSPELEFIYGYDRTKVHDYDDFRKRVHPDDVAAMEAARDAAIRKRKPFDLEFRIVLASGEVRWLSARGRGFYDRRGRVVRVVGSNIVITERKQAEAALRASEEQFRRAIEEAPIPVIMHAEDGQVLQVSRTWTTLTGYRPEDIPTFEAWLNQAYGEGANAVRRHVQQLFKGKRRTIGIEFPVRTRDGQTRHWSFSASAPGTLVDGRRFVVGMAVDITERKQRELNTALLDEIGRDLSILSAPDEIMQTVGKRLGGFLGLSGCYFVDVDEARKEVTVHYGWARKKSPSLMQTFKLEDYLNEDFLRTMRAGTAFVMRDTARDERAEAKSYARLKVGSFVTVPFFRHGRYIGHIAVTTGQPHDWQPQEIQLLQEISSRIFPRIERARAEAALRESEEKFRTLFESIDEGFALIEVLPDERGRVTDLIYREANKAFERHTGMRDFLGKRASEKLPNLGRELFDLMTGIYQTGKPVRAETYVADLRRWYRFHYSRVGGAGSPIIAAVFEDITARKQGEAALRASEQKYRNLFESMADQVHFWRLVRDKAGRIKTWRLVDINPPALKSWGKTREETVGRTADEIFPGATKHFMPIVRKIFAEGRPHSWESLFPGLQQHLQMTSVPLDDHFITTGTDVTDLKRISELNRRQAELLDFAHDTIFIRDEQDRITYWNAGASLHYGWSKEQVLGKVTHTLLKTKFPEPIAKIRATLKRTGRWSGELQHTCRDGRVLTVDSRWAVQRDEHGKGFRILEINNDITARKQVEAALRESRNFNAAVLDNAGALVVVLDRKGRIRRFNRAAEQLSGYRFAEVEGKYPWETVLPADEAAKVRREAFETLARNPQSLSGHYTNFWADKNGQKRLISWHNTLLFDPDGRMEHMVSIGTDITERKQAEVALQASREQLQQLNTQLEARVATRTAELIGVNERLRAVVDTKLVGIITIDKRGLIVTVNRGLTEMFGYAPEELIGRNVSILMNTSDRATHDSHLARYRRTGRKRIVEIVREVSARRKNGEEFPVDLNVTEFRSGGQRYFAGILRDISERRRLETEVTGAYERAQRELAVELHDGLGQHLLGLKLFAESLTRRLEQAGAAGTDEMRRYVHMLDEGICQARNMARGLRPVDDVPEGLMFGLKKLTADLNATGQTMVRFHCPRPVLVADHPVASHLFRIAQEAASNALKHARCRNISISLTATAERVMLAVRDDGIGLRPDRRAGIGLHVMQYRANAIRGSLVVQNLPVRGTVVVCSVARSPAP